MRTRADLDIPNFPPNPQEIHDMRRMTTKDRLENETDAYVVNALRVLLGELNEPIDGDVAVLKERLMIAIGLRVTGPGLHFSGGR